ncbi:hypothetical protein [Amycolatopsis lexingtonensis]|uniref:hypothetical protein n=1 Tax=Amycolatopsis lexingtonensis TaxID=218822 RepID=UPI003F703FE6
MTFRFSLLGYEIFAFDLFRADFGGSVDEGEPGERVRLGANVELADDEQPLEDRFELPFGFGPTTAPPETE